MAMVVYNNLAALNTLNKLNKNSKGLKKNLEKVASGMKINSAGDAASEYSISERMRVRIRGLDQDVQNVKNGRDLLNVAAGGIHDIVATLRNMKELAINSANDTNTDADRATLQKVFVQKKEHIDEIVSTTDYNGKLLLDGRYMPPVYYSHPKNNVVTPEPTGIITMVSTGDYIIQSDGVYMLSSGYTGKITIAENAQNVKIQQANPGVALENVYIEAPSPGKANLWIENLNISNTEDVSVINFNGTDNNLTLKGRNILSSTIKSHLMYGTIPVGGDYYQAIVDIGKGLRIKGEGSLYVERNKCPDSVDRRFPGLYEGAGIGCDGYLGEGEHATNTDYLIIDSGYISVTGDAYCSGAGIGSGELSAMGYIDINGGEVNVEAVGTGAAIGAGRCGTVREIFIDTHVRAIADAGAGIGTSDFDAGYLTGVEDIIIWRNADITATSNSGAAIGSGWMGHGGDITIHNRSHINAKSLGYQSLDNPDVWYISDDIGAGYCGTIGRIIHLDELQRNPLVIHHGTKAGEAINCYINDLHSDAMKLYNTSLTTREGARFTIDRLDYAIDYALNEATNVGAYISRLEYTENNLITANENTQSAESVIRDADMAKEMTEYTKNNVLLQASQSMLAQANQNSSSVLSLLQ